MTTDQSPTALVIGESLIDIVLDGAAAVEHPGGSPLNVSLGLGRLGMAVDFLTRVGDDDRGHRIIRHLASADVRLVAGPDAGRTSTARAEIRADGSAVYDFDIDWSLAVGAPDLPKCDVLHFGSLAAVIEPGATQLEAIVAANRGHSTITFDPNIRPQLQGERDEARRRVEAQVAACDVVKASDEDLGWLFPEEDPARIARAWVALGASLVVVTAGGRGAIAVTGKHEVSVAAPPVAVVDTIGAGDSFMAGLISGLDDEGLLGGGNRRALAGMDERRLTAVIERAARAAAITVSRPGADPPTREELDGSLER